MKQLSICIPTWNRYELTIDSFSQVYNDERVKNIIIVDDCSDDEIYVKLALMCRYMDKVHLYQNDTNLDCYRNKREAVSKATTDYCIVLDSDNEIGIDYLDALYKEEWDEDTILMPSFARPMFDYRDYSGITLTKENLAEYIDKPLIETCLNCMNYFVNAKNYLEVWDGSVDPVTSDSLFQNYNWIMSARKFKIVSGLEYEHKVHDGSHYINNVHRTGDFKDILIEKIRNLK